MRWLWRCLSMIPFCYVVFTLTVGLAEATSIQPSSAAASLASPARYLTVFFLAHLPLCVHGQECRPGRPRGHHD